MHGEASPVSSEQWGVYANLAGTAWLGGNRIGDNSFGSNWKITVEWREVGVELVERWELLDKSGRVMTHVITRGDQPGELRMAATNGVCDSRTGTVQPDGSVLFVCTGFFKWPMHVVAPQGGVWEQHYVSLNGSEIAGIKDVWRFQSQSGVSANDPRVASAAAVQAPSRAATDAPAVQAVIGAGSPTDANPLADWGAWLPLASQVWRKEGTGDWSSHAQLLEFTWHAGPSPRMEVSRRNEHGVVSASGDLTLGMDGEAIFTEEKRLRFIYKLEPQGTLLETEQQMPLFFGTDWETARSTRYWAFLPDERWGLMRQLVGYSWYESELPAQPTGDRLFRFRYDGCLTFSWSPVDQTIETAWRADSSGGTTMSIHMIGRNPEELEGYVEYNFWQGNNVSRRTQPWNAQFTDEQLIFPDLHQKNARRVLQLDDPTTLVRQLQKLNNGRWETVYTERFIRETPQQKSRRLFELARLAEEKASRERTRASIRASEAVGQVLSGVKPVVNDYVEQSRRRSEQTLENARRIAAERARAEREEKERQYQADWQHARKVLAQQEQARQDRAGASRAEAETERKQQSVAQATQQQRRVEDTRRRESAEAERKRQQEAEAEQEERRRREEAAQRERAERDMLARSKQLEEEVKRQEEEARNRPVIYREGITLCEPPKNGGKAWLCRGPLQNMSGVLDTQSGNVAVRQACGGNNIRDLGMVAGYRAYGCGFGIHPTDRDAPNRDIPASLGVNHIPDRGTFRCNPNTVFAYCKGR
ncbi:hypothetical protein GCM10027343_17040 [Noviherbaspirillum agri]